MPLIGDEIRKARQKRGMSQETLAQAIGTTKATISRYESGDRNPPLEQLQKIATTLNISIHSLISSEPGILDPLLPSEMHGMELKETTVDEDTLCYMLDQMIHIEQINPDLYQRLKRVLYGLAVSSGLEHVLIYYGSIYDDDDLDLSTPAARAIIDKISGSLKKAVPFQKLSDAEAHKAGFLQFKSDEDRIAFFYSRLNIDGKLVAGRHFFRHLAPDSKKEVADYVEKLSEAPQYQRKEPPSDSPTDPSEDE